MITKSILNPDSLLVIDESSKMSYYGCDQDWYKTQWQRASGCGPSVACNIMFYLTNTDRDRMPKENWLKRMEESWQYVTPTVRGISSSKLFCKLMADYIDAKGLDFDFSRFEVAAVPASRLPIKQLLHFIEVALSKDMPVAFLNLSNGKVENLDSWHWVTVVAISYEENGSAAFVKVFDSGELKTVDLLLWYKSTILGGGFVSLSHKERAQVAV